MSLKVLSGIFDFLKLKSTGVPACITGTSLQKRNRRHCPAPRLRIPYWRIKQERATPNELLTDANQEFLKRIIKEKYSYADPSLSANTPLKEEPLPKGNWFPGCMRSGLIAIKLGRLPQWYKNGKVISTTLLQVVDNHVISYIPPEKKVDLRPYAKRVAKYTKHLGDLVVGAINDNPQRLTGQYCGLFTKAGVMPKKVLTKFSIHPEAIIQPGTPLYASHFQVGDVVDVTGKTIYQGFQGVMKRWGFSGQPASHGQTKTHRRPGNIGGGGEKARVWPGKKMPGHVGNKHRTAKGLTVVRINHKHNILYVTGNIPGEINSVVFVHDTLLKRRVRTTSPPFPTYYPENQKEPLPDEEFHETLFKFSDPTIVYEVEKVTAKKAKK